MKLQTWKNAQAICNQAGMELLRIESKADEGYFFNLLTLDDSIWLQEPIFLGGMKLGDGWIWRSDYSNIYPDMQWGLTDPDNKGNREFCLAVEKNIDNGEVGYIDVSCSDIPFAFICQPLETSCTRKNRLVGLKIVEVRKVYNMDELQG